MTNIGNATNRNKFKVGDKVKLNSNIYCINLNHIDTYTVAKSYADAITLIGFDYAYVANLFVLAEQVEDTSNTSNILTPLQVAEALINKEALEYTYNGTLWMSVEQEDDEIFFYNDGVYRYRRKPKTIIINGFEVPAPLSEIPKEGIVYYPNVARGNIGMNYAKNIRFTKLFWRTREDAQKILDAMLAPFNDIDKGE